MKLSPELKEIAQRVINSMYHEGKTVGNAYHFLEGFLDALPNSEPEVSDDMLLAYQVGAESIKRQLAESQARENKLRATFRANMIRAFPSMSHAEVSDEIDKAVGLTSATALNELIAKAGEVMRERALEAFVYRSDTTCMTIRALPGVTLEDL